MAKPLTPQQLKKLWDKKLKQSGFEDIEDDQGRLKEWSSRAWRNNEHENLQDTAAAKLEYYNMCTTFLNEHPFESRLEQVIWEYYTEGISYRNIAKLLKKAKIKKTNRTTVMYIIRRLEATMKGYYSK